MIHSFPDFDFLEFFALAVWTTGRGCLYARPLKVALAALKGDTVRFGQGLLSQLEIAVTHVLFLIYQNNDFFITLLQSKTSLTFVLLVPRRF